MSSESGLDRATLEATLHNLELLREERKRALDAKRRQHQRLEAEIRAEGMALHNLSGSIVTVREQLGLQTEEQGILVLQESQPDPDHLKGVIDNSRAIMLIVARHNERGGISFEQIFNAAKEEGLDITREYLHTILNRKRNRQEKLARRDDKWFLTPKGKGELGIRD